ncbi:MAG: efflux RND transporter periplasmic adaptor subunit [Bacteroidales bacterium]
MKIKIIIAFMAIVTFISCNTNNQKIEKVKAHEEHSSENTVTLTKGQQEALNLKLGAFSMRNLTTVIKTNGTLEVPPSYSANITSIIGGNVKEIKVFDGDWVKKGQLLVILEHPDYISIQEDYAEITNRLEFLKQEFERQKELFKNNVSAGKTFQKTKADYYSAKSKSEGLKSRLKLLNLSPEAVMNGNISNTIKITSPINGFINNVNIKIGSYVDAKDVILEVTDNDAIHADFMIYEKDVFLLKKGQKVHFTVSNRPDKELTAKVFAIDKEFLSNPRALKIHAKIEGKVSDLIPGMYISGHLHTDEKYTKTLPNTAIVKEGTKSFIFIVDNHKIVNNKITLKMVEVVTGLQDEGYTEIKLLNSLPKDTKIVINGAYYLLADINKEETEHDH